MLAFAKQVILSLLTLALVLGMLFCACISYLRNPAPDLFDTVAVLPALITVMHGKTLYAELNTWSDRIIRLFRSGD